MSEFMSFRSRAAIAGSVVAMGLLANGCSGDDLEMHEFELGEKQAESFHESARLGRLGLRNFENIVDPVDAWTTGLVDVTEYNHDGTIDLDSSAIVGCGFVDTVHVAPSQGADGSSVVYQKNFENRAGEAQKVAVFRNPDTTFFGDDGMASHEEIRKFFEDDQTTLSRVDYLAKDIVSGECQRRLAVGDDSYEAGVQGNCMPYDSSQLGDIKNIKLAFGL